MSSFTAAEREYLTGATGGRRLAHVATVGADRTPHVASTDPWHPRGVEVRGRAEAVQAPEALIRIRADRVVSWGLGG